VLIDAAGAEQAGASVPTPFAASADGIDMSVAALEGALCEVVAALGPTRESVAAVGVAGLAESGAPLLAGRPVGPIIAWHDGRGEETVASLERRFGPDLPRRTGRRLRTVSSLAKLGWLLDHGLAVPDRWLGVPELALWLLSGCEATEHSLAARTGAYDVLERRWLPAVIAHVLGRAAPEQASVPRGGPEWAGPGEAEGEPGDRVEPRAAGAMETVLPLGLFPAVRAAGTAMGFVTQEAAAAYGLTDGIPVTIAGHDHLAAAAGLGAGPGDLLNSVGTAETLLRRLDAAPDMDRALELDLAVTVWPGGDAWCVLASAARSGVVLGELAASFGRSPEELDRLAISFVRSPAEQKRLAPSGTAAGRAWSDSLADLAARTVAAGARVADLVGPHDRLIVFGGGSRSIPWLAAKAAAAGVPVFRCTVADAAARGAGVAAGSAAGWWGAGAGPRPAVEPVNPPSSGENEAR
jgi:xylulokinase